MAHTMADGRKRSVYFPQAMLDEIDTRMKKRHRAKRRVIEQQQRDRRKARIELPAATVAEMDEVEADADAWLA